jgi:hypothetical protein
MDRINGRRLNVGVHTLTMGAEDMGAEDIGAEDIGAEDIGAEDIGDSGVLLNTRIAFMRVVYINFYFS